MTDLVTTIPNTQKLLNRIQELLPVTDNDIVQRGITETAMARIVELRQRADQLAERYGSIEILQERIQADGDPIEIGKIRQIFEHLSISQGKSLTGSESSLCTKYTI